MLYYERRRPEFLKFYNDSNKKIGRQAFGSRLKPIFDLISEPFTLIESDNAIRVKLKRSLGFVTGVKTT